MMRSNKSDRVAAGELLSRAGAAKGGEARAERLTPSERQAIARVAALERHGKLVRVRFTSLEYDSDIEGPGGEMVARCLFEIEHAAQPAVSGHALIEQRITRRDSPMPFELSATPEWVERDLLGELAVDYRRRIVDSRIVPPVGSVFGMIAESRARLADERIYEFAVTDGGWELVRWR